MESYIGVFIIFIVLAFIYRQERLRIIKRKIDKRKGRKTEMLKLAEQFIGKRCLFYTFNSQVAGTVKEIGENGILIEEKENLQIINPDYIVRIREYPKNKKGKYKDVIFD
ncbi:MAG: hypothetical protein IIX36_05230 [Clostridia bacterium]|nr:hypothetical protein [Clostridia bacterium]